MKFCNLVLALLTGLAALPEASAKASLQCVQLVQIYPQLSLSELRKLNGYLDRKTTPILLGESGDPNISRIWFLSTSRKKNLPISITVWLDQEQNPVSVEVTTLTSSLRYAFYAESGLDVDTVTRYVHFPGEGEQLVEVAGKIQEKLRLKHDIKINEFFQYLSQMPPDMLFDSVLDEDGKKTGKQVGRFFAWSDRYRKLLMLTVVFSVDSKGKRFLLTAFFPENKY